MTRRNLFHPVKMIDAGFFKENDGFRVIITGHAGYATEGQDIVCASVSTLFYTMVGYLHTLKGSKCKVHKLQKGYAEMSCSAVGEEALRMTCIGILQVSEQYPQCVRLHNEIWKSRFGAHNGVSMAAPSLSGDQKRSIYTWKKKLFRTFPIRKIL